MTVSVTAGTIVDDLAIRRELFRTEGPPPTAVGAMGNMLAMLKKGTTQLMTRKVKGDGRILIPFNTLEGSNAAPNFGKAASNHQPQEWERFDAPLSRLWSFLILDWEVDELGQDGGTLGVQPRDRMNLTEMSWWKTLSWLIWEDGTGRLGKFDPTVNLASTTGKFLNRRCIHRLRQGDRISLNAAGAIAPGTLAVRREGIVAGEGGFVTVTKINPTLGTFTVDTAFSTAIPTAAVTDHIVLDNSYEGTSLSSGGKAQPIAGIGLWVPARNSDAIQPLFGLARDVNPEQRAGIRIKIDQSGFRQAIRQLATRLGDLPRDVNEDKMGTLWFPQHREAELIEALEAEKISVRFTKEAARENNKETMQFGVGPSSVACFSSGHVIRLMSDRMFCDQLVTEDEDWTMRVMLDDTFEVHTSKSSVNWQLRGQTVDTILQPIDGTSEELAAPYGAILQAVTTVPAAHMVLSPDADQ